MPVRVAIGQMVVPVAAPEADTRQAVVQMATTAVKSGATVVVLPELSVPGYTTDIDVLRRSAESVPGPTTEALVELAKRSDAVIVVGLAETSGASVFNTAVAISGD